ncbi:fructose-1,6-bisphosphatase class 1/Sedoheputulose-1,7-bisphosphatase [Protomyces lactucae-debilis]|uniref:Fructose-1,6-bisphosphatase n=1 Tax=Protomyces lactucae-debilis TaxID=2754530 RepID=A0A1Y2FKI7_PROLT|nr:fructose-1,6-bisphosphatase class 1/Sedoheputulose-1,7-bisphosphatase [Protomyces lactucae-debilis]ORY83305.1 fructose-1,6-bisphosphatase class 1/Sedoheputulose-1,7-bisphosphatase [Protomyces lactucae-debilis]
MAAEQHNQSAAYGIVTDYQTLTKHFLQEQQQAGSKATGDFTILLNAIQFTCKVIAHNIRRANLLSLGGLAGATNSTGDDQKKLDIISNDIFLDAMKACGRVSVIISEEEEEAIIVEGVGGNNGRYCVACDPIDGSSNLDAGVSVGTIFGIYKCQEGSSGSLSDVLRSGTEMIVAGYCMYAASANLIITTGNGLNGFTLDNALGEFILTHPQMKIPKSRSIYSVNEGNSMYWDEPCKKYFEALKYPESGKPYSARYIGSMVADVHRTLLYGGIFAYPADSKSKNGKLRVLYECFPMAMIVEQAGGLATDGRRRILDIVPKDIHERSGIFLGSEDEVNKLLAAYKQYGN